MELFQSISEFYQILGVCTLELNRTYSFNWKILAYYLSIVSTTISQLAFLLFKAESAMDVGNFFYGFSTQISTVWDYSTTLWEISNILKFIERSKRLIRRRVGSNSNRLTVYNDLIDKIERQSNSLYTIMVKYSCAGIVMPGLMAGLTNYYVLGLGDESFQSNAPMILPFSWETPLGYLGFAIFLLISVFTIVSVALPTISLLICSSWFFICFIKDIANDLPQLIRNGKKLTKNRGMQVKRRFCRIVQDYTEINQLVNGFNEIYTFKIVGLFVWTVLAIATMSLVFLHQLADDHVTPTDLSTTLVIMSWSFIIIFFYCEFGETVTHHFSMFHEQLCQCDWYKMPIDVQRMLIIFMSDTSSPASIRGYGNTECTRDAFKDTIHGGFSYLMMLRQMDV